MQKNAPFFFSHNLSRKYIAVILQRFSEKTTRKRSRTLYNTQGTKETAKAQAEKQRGAVPADTIETTSENTPQYENHHSRRVHRKATRKKAKGARRNGKRTDTEPKGRRQRCKPCEMKEGRKQTNESETGKTICTGNTGRAVVVGK